MERHLVAAEATLAQSQLAGLRGTGSDDSAVTAQGSDQPPAAAAAQTAAQTATADSSEGATTATGAVSAVELADGQSLWAAAVRRQWLLGRIAELRRQPAAAAAAFAACRRILVADAMPLHVLEAAGHGAAAQAEQSLESGAAAATAAQGQAAEAAAAAADIAPEAPRILLRGCVHDAVISEATLDAKLQASGWHYICQSQIHHVINHMLLVRGLHSICETQLPEVCPAKQSHVSMCRRCGCLMCWKQGPGC